MKKLPKFSKSAILVEQKQPLVVDYVELPSELSYGQVLVEIFVSGICGSQIGEIKGVKGKDNFLPHLLGHEGVATVLEVGPSVKNIAIGDKVVIHWRPGKGINAKTPTYKYKGGKINAGWATTFNEFAIISENRVTKINNKYDMKLLTNYTADTLTALSPLSSDSTSNSTAWSCLSVLKSFSDTMLEKCTKTSVPSSLVMKP